VSDSRVTLPVETFALLLKTQITRFKSESDDRLIDICASENPQCRLTRKGGYVTLENLSSIFSPDTDRSLRNAVPHAEPVDSASTPAITSSEDPEDEALNYQIPQSELKKLLAIISPEMNHRAEPTTSSEEPAKHVPAPEIESSQVLEDDTHENETIESELKNPLSIISAEADHRAEPATPHAEAANAVPATEIVFRQAQADGADSIKIIESEPKDLASMAAPQANRRAEPTIPPFELDNSVPTPEIAIEEVQGNEIHTGGNLEDDEEPPKTSKLKPMLGSIGVVAVVLALVGYAIYSCQQAQVEAPGSIAIQGTNSSPNSEVANSGIPAAQDRQGVPASPASQMKAPFGTWIDPATGLMWTLRDNRSDVNWKQAAEYCRDLRLAGYDDWRLPMVEELQGIYDAGAKVSGHCCGGTQVSMQVRGKLSLSGWQWSSSQRAQYGTPFSFYNGGRYTNLLSDRDGGRALCVRTLGQLLSRPTSGSEE
jgi:hypothetical protein